MRHSETSVNRNRVVSEVVQESLCADDHVFAALLLFNKTCTGKRISSRRILEPSG